METLSQVEINNFQYVINYIKENINDKDYKLTLYLNGYNKKFLRIICNDESIDLSIPPFHLFNYEKLMSASIDEFIRRVNFFTKK
jgi:hypothetical protein